MSLLIITPDATSWRCDRCHTGTYRETTREGMVHLAAMKITHDRSLGHHVRGFFTAKDPSRETT